jgi:hypothetical protein
MEKTMRATLLVLCALVALAAAAHVDCGNGNVCPIDHTCVSTVPFAGQLYGCAPAVNATICPDSRFSCPSANDCGDAQTCVDIATGASMPVLNNVAASSRALATEVGGVSMCAYIKSILPSFCTCVDGALFRSTLQCSVNFLKLDTIGVKAILAPCDTVPFITLDITEKDHHIDFPIASLASGTTKTIPIPGLSVAIPDFGNAGVNVAIKFLGTYVFYYLLLLFNYFFFLTLSSIHIMQLI